MPTKELSVGMNWIQCVLSKFKDCKLTLNHTFMCSKIIEIPFLKSVELGLVATVMVSLQIRFVWIRYL